MICPPSNTRRLDDVVIPIFNILSSVICASAMHVTFCITILIVDLVKDLDFVLFYCEAFSLGPLSEDPR